LLFASTYAHTASRVRCACFDATSWRAPRSGPRRAPRGSPLEPLCARKRRYVITSLMFARNQAYSAFASTASKKPRSRKGHACRKTKVFAMCYAPPLAQISNKNGIAKTFANASPSAGCDICPADGGILQNKKPDGGCLAVGCQGESQGERLGFLLGYFLGNAKK